MVDFRDVIENMKDIGFFDVILPFLLVYAIVYAVLEKSRIFYINKGDSEDKNLKGVSMIVSFVISIFSVASLTFVSWTQSFLAYISFGLIFFVGLMIVLGLIFGDDWIVFFKDGDKWNMKVLYVFGAIIVILGVIFAINSMDIDLDLDIADTIGNSSSDIISILVIVGIVLILYFISKEGPSKKEEKDDKEES